MRGCRRSLPVTSSGGFCRAEPRENGRPPDLLAAGISRPLGPPLAASVLALVPRPLPSWVCTSPGASVPGVAGDLRLSPTPPSPHTSEGPGCCLAAVFRGPSPEERALTAAFALAGRSDASSAPSSCNQGRCWALPQAGGAAVVPGAPCQPSPLPKFASLLFRGGGSAPRGSWSLGPQLVV